MAGGEFSTDVSLGVLTPASSVRPVGSKSSNQDPQPKPRRQPRDEQAIGDLGSESDENSEHELDRLA